MPLVGLQLTARGKDDWLLYLIVIYMSEFVSLPHCAVGWSAVSDGGIILSYSLIFRGCKSCLYLGAG